MITLTAKLEIVNNVTISSLSSDYPKNNISCEFSEVVTNKNKYVEVKNPFILGASKLGDGSTLENNVDYFMGLPFNEETEYGTFLVNATIENETSGSLIFEFDTRNNRFPNQVNVGNTQTYIDNPISIIKSINAPYVIFGSNAEKYPIVISKIYTDLDIEINAKNIISLEGSIFSRGDNKLPSYGIISNTGRLEFNDHNRKVLEYIKNNKLKKVTTKLYLINTLVKDFKTNVGTYYSDKLEYDNDNRKISQTFIDDLEEWQDIQVQGFSCNPLKPYQVLQNGSMQDLYNYLKEHTPSKYNMLSFDNLDGETKRILSNTFLEYPYLESGSLWKQWNKLCQICQLYIYKNNKGQTVCRTYLGV